jgi:hypothetical protein
VKYEASGGIAKLGGCILLSVLLAAGSAAARGKSEDARPRRHSATQLAAQRLQAGIAALSGRDFAGAYRALAEAFRLEPSPEILYHLGTLALAEDRMLDAQDLMRRYLTDSEATSDPGSPMQKEAHRVVALPRPPSGKLQVLGQRGTILSIDGRVLGSLPLARPLLVSPSEHRVALELSGQRQEEQVQVPPAASPSCASKASPTPS